MKDYQKKIETLKDDIIDDIIKITKKKGKYYGHHFIIVDNDVIQAVRYGQDLDYNLRDRQDDYKHLSIHFNNYKLNKINSNDYYVDDTQEGKCHQAHFDARLIDVDTLYYILETIKQL